MERNIAAGIQDLKASIGRIREQKEWDRLFQREEERAGPDSPRFRNPTEVQMKLETGWFWKLHLDLEELLGKEPVKNRKKWKPRLQRLTTQFQSLIKTKKSSL